MCISAIIGAGASIIGGAMASSSAGKAAKAQENASNASLALQREQFETSQENMQPWLDTGSDALAEMRFEMGLGERPVFGQDQPQNALVDPTTLSIKEQTIGGIDPGAYGHDESIQQLMARQNPARTVYAVGDQQFDTNSAAQNYLAEQYQKFNAQGTAAPTGGFEYQGFKATPGYEFRMAQGEKAIQRSAAARGGLNSGATLKALGQWGQDYGSAEYGNYMNRLSALAGTGQTQTNALASLGANFANSGSNAIMAGGQARASGYAQKANIMSGTMNQLGSFAGNYLGGMGGGGGSIGGVGGYSVPPIQGMPGIY